MAASGTAMLALLVAACGNPPVLQLVDKELAGDPGNPFVRAMGSFAY